jgi:hypothetical protein
MIIARYPAHRRVIDRKRSTWRIAIVACQWSCIEAKDFLASRHGETDGQFYMSGR